jgi:hypothetical protein
MGRLSSDTLLPDRTVVGDGIQCLPDGQLQFYGLSKQPPALVDEHQQNLLTRFQQHPCWQDPKGWKRRLNNVQLLIGPFISFSSLKPWLTLFEIPALHRGFAKLINIINRFPRWLPLAPFVPTRQFSPA